MREVVINSGDFAEQKELHRYLREQLEFPDYYGGNLSALYDCLTELSGEVLMVLNETGIVNEEMKSYLETVWRVCQDAARENPGIHLSDRRA